MLRRSFNEGWEHRPKVSRFLEMTGSAHDWVPVRLPHDAMLQRPRDGSDPNLAPVAYFTPGADEYRRQLEVPREWRHKRVVLEFEGAYRDAMVYLNDALLAARPSGYTEFTVDLDPHLRYGDTNLIRVETRTYDDSRWYTGAGVYRNVSIVVSELVHIALDGLEITTPNVERDRTTVVVTAHVENESAASRLVRVATTVVDAEGNDVVSDSVPLTVMAGERIALRRRLLVESPRLWSVEHPFLYTCVTTVFDGERRLDQARATFGIRSLSLDPRDGLRVNGEKVKLRGACVHHDNGPIGAATIDRAEERRVELLKGAGFNALRSAHQPMSRAMLDACDRLGVLVMDEAFDAWTMHKADHDYAGRFLDWWEADIEAMVRKDVNHPSVVLYCIGNEVPEAGSSFGATWARRIAEKVRMLDPARFTTIAVNPLLLMLDDIGRYLAETPPPAEDTGVNTAMSWFDGLVPTIIASEESARRTEESFAAVDVAGYNYAGSCYGPDRVRFPHRVILGTETCPPAIDELWALVTAHDHIIGDFTWTGWDYLGEVGVGRVEHGDAPGPGEGPPGFMAEYPWLTAWVGDLDITGHRRPISYWREIVFGLRKDPFLAVRRPEHHGRPVRHASPWAWSDAIASWSWRGNEGAPVCVEVYADADEVELLLDGRSLGSATAGRAERFKALFDVTYDPGTLVAVARTAGTEVGRCELRSATGDVHLRLEPDRDRIRADDTDLAFVTITLVDGDGNLCSDSDRAISLDLDGPSTLHGFGSANPCSARGFDTRTHTTFDGRALAVLRPTGVGEVTLRAEAEGVAAASVKISVGPGVSLPGH